MVRFHTKDIELNKNACSTVCFNVHRNARIGDNMNNQKRYCYLTSEIDAAYHEAALKFGVSDSAMRILYTICLNGVEFPLSDVVRLSGIPKQTINSALRKLEKEEILYLETANGRNRQVILTDKGIALAKKSALPVQKMENEIFSSWSKQERELYFQLTERFLSSFKKKIKEINV